MNPDPCWTKIWARIRVNERARGLGSAGLAQKIDFINFKRFSVWRKPPT